MTNLPPKPEGSIIEEVHDFDGRTYRWKLPKGGKARFFVTAFLIFWLCGWAHGFVNALVNLLRNAAGNPDLFLLFWLGAWTVGGIFVFFMLFLQLRPQRPESIQLRHDSSIHAGKLDAR